jgi:hypothetical protein
VNKLQPEWAPVATGQDLVATRVGAFRASGAQTLLRNPRTHRVARASFRTRRGANPTSRACGRRPPHVGPIAGRVRSCGRRTPNAPRAPSQAACAMHPTHPGMRTTRSPTFYLNQFQVWTFTRTNCVFNPKGRESPHRSMHSWYKT